MVHIDFYFDIVCPNAYIASTQIDSLVQETNATVTWKPVLLGDLYEPLKAPDAPKKRLYFGRETAMQIERYNVTLNAPPKYPISTLYVMRFLTYVKEPNARMALAHGLYRSFWVLNDKVDDASIACDVILALLQKLDVGNASNALKGMSKLDVMNVIENNETIKEELKSNTKNACLTYNMFDVPTFIVDNNVKNMFWGVERIPFLKQFCMARKHKVLYPPTDLIMMPLIREKMVNDNDDYYSKNRENNTIEFFFDFTSPWSFLGYMRLKEFNAFAKKIVLRPVVLGAIFKAVGTQKGPLEAVGPMKRIYVEQDLARWFAACGVSMTWNSAFPLRTVLASRVFIVDNSTIDCLFKAAWQQDINIGDPKELCKLLDRHGFNGEKLIKAANDVNIKNQLKNGTGFAIEKGIFGVPAYVVNNDYERFVWGQEKMDFVKEMCHGWVAPTKSSIFKKESGIKPKSSKL